MRHGGTDCAESIVAVHIFNTGNPLIALFPIGVHYATPKQMESRAIPNGLVVFQDRSGIVIRRRWAKSGGAYVLFVAAATAWPILLMYPGRSHGDGLWPLLTEYLPHIGTVIGGGYFGLCSLFNRTDVIITVDRFKAVSAPLPWWGDRKISAQEIYAVTIKEQNKAEDGAKFALKYIDRYGRECELLRAGKGREQIDFIGHAVADIMGVEFRDPDPKAGALSPWMQRVNRWTSGGHAEDRIGKLKTAKNGES